MTKNKNKTDMEIEQFAITVTNPETGATHRTLSYSHSPTVLVTFAANRFTRSVSRMLQPMFGIGAMDWRMLVILTREPGIAVSKASQTIGIDKAAVSRSLARLEEKKLATAFVPAKNGRRREWRLTAKGQKLHDEIVEVTLQRQKTILAGFSKPDIDKFNEYLVLLMNNIEALDQDN